VLIKPWICDKVEVKPAPSGGKGMYATGSFVPGEKIGAFGGAVMSDEQYLELRKTKTDDDLNMDQAMYIHPGLILMHDPEMEYYPLCFSNHSCDANAKVKDGIVLVAARAISPGEEICWDYRITDNVGIWGYEFKCGCGSPKCGGAVKIGPKHRIK